MNALLALLGKTLSETLRYMRWVALSLIVLLAVSWLLIAFDGLSPRLTLDPLGPLSGYSAISLLVALMMILLACLLFVLLLLRNVAVAIWRLIRGPGEAAGVVGQEPADMK